MTYRRKRVGGRRPTAAGIAPETHPERQHTAPPPPEPPGSSPQNSPPRKKRRLAKGCAFGTLGILGIIGLVVVVIIVVVIIAVSNGSKKVTTTPTALGGSAPAAAYTVGQTAKTGGLDVTVYSFKDPQPPPNQITSPTAGSHFVSVDVQVKNPRSSQVPFSSLLGFHLLDSANHQYDETATSGVTPGPPDGQIAGGQSIRGFVVFEVPDGTTGLKFRAQGQLTAAGAVFTLG